MGTEMRVIWMIAWFSVSAFFFAKGIIGIIRLVRRRRAEERERKAEQSRRDLGTFLEQFEVDGSNVQDSFMEEFRTNPMRYVLNLLQSDDSGVRGRAIEELREVAEGSGWTLNNVVGQTRTVIQADLKRYLEKECKLKNFDIVVASGVLVIKTELELDEARKLQKHLEEYIPAGVELVVQGVPSKKTEAWLERWAMR